MTVLWSLTTVAGSLTTASVASAAALEIFMSVIFSLSFILIEESASRWLALS